MRISDWSSDVCSSDLGSQADPASTAQGPVDSTARRHGAGDVLAEALIERRAPRHELKAQPFVDHREAARRKRHPLPVDAADIVACARRFVLKSRARGDGLRGGCQFLILQRPDEVLSKDDPLALPAGKPLCRSEEHTSELQSLMRISYAVF